MVHKQSVGKGILEHKSCRDYDLFCTFATEEGLLNRLSLQNQSTMWFPSNFPSAMEFLEVVKSLYLRNVFMIFTMCYISSYTEYCRHVYTCPDVYVHAHYSQCIYMYRQIWCVRIYYDVFSYNDVNGGCWTVFKRRCDGTENLYRTMSYYLATVIQANGSACWSI